MDKIIEKANELSSLLKEEPLIKEYLHVKDLYENSKELEYMRQEIAHESNQKDKSRYKELKDKYDNHPLVSNYNSLKEEVITLLKELNEIIL